MRRSPVAGLIGTWSTSPTTSTTGTVEGAPDDSGPIHGKDAVRAWLQDWIDTFDEFWFEPVELIDAGEDTVVAVERFGGRAKLSGIEIDQTEAVVYSIRGGKLARCREYPNRARPSKPPLGVSLGTRRGSRFAWRAQQRRCGILRARCRRRTWR